MYFKKEYFLIAVFFIISFMGCKKNWDSSNINQDLTKDLVDAIAANTSLSKFLDYVKKTGVDVILSSSKTFTVWAPTDAALAALDPAIVSDTAKLRLFVLNHISNQSYFSKDVQTSIRVPMLNGKFNNFYVGKFEDANITAADQFVKNGVLNVIDKPILFLPNVWEFIISTTAQYIQNSFLAGLNYTTFDPTLAIIDSISSTTGQPVYRPGTGFVTKNLFNERVYDLRKEDQQYTYFVIADGGFILKADSLKPYYNSTSTVSTDSLDKWNIAKDLVFDVLYPTAASIPSVLLSKYGISVPVNKTLIITTRKLSNGVVYVLSLSDVPTYTKFTPVTVEGESPTGFLSNKTSNTNYRVRTNLATGLNFTDILVSGHGTTSYYAYYRLNEMPSMKYNVYAFAINDFQTAAVVQKLAPFYLTPPATYTALGTLTHNVPLSTAVGAYNEVLLGQFTSTLYGTIDIRLTATGTAPIVLDYFRLVPVP